MRTWGRENVRMEGRKVTDRNDERTEDARTEGRKGEKRTGVGRVEDGP
jgi:hypothetical protein